MTSCRRIAFLIPAYNDKVESKKAESIDVEEMDKHAQGRIEKRGAESRLKQSCGCLSYSEMNLHEIEDK